MSISEAIADYMNKEKEINLLVISKYTNYEFNNKSIELLLLILLDARFINKHKHLYAENNISMLLVDDIRQINENIIEQFMYSKNTRNLNEALLKEHKRLKKISNKIKQILKFIGD